MSKDRIFSYLILILLVIFWMHNWFGNVLPLYPREENVNDISYLWTLVKSYQNHFLLSGWSPLNLTGNTNLLQRGYFLFAPLSIFINRSGLSVESVYSGAVAITFLLSGIGFYEYLRKLKLSLVSCFIGGLVYMFLPPHLSLTLDALDFNFYWAILPWLFLTTQWYIHTNKAVMYGALLGLLTAVGFITGTTYFVSTMPFFCLFLWLQILSVGKNSLRSQMIFAATALTFFVGISAYYSLPLITEYPHIWAFKESQRKNIFTIPSLSEIIGIHWLRLKGVSTVSWDLKKNYPDFSFYLGISTIVFSSLNLFIQKFRIKALIPALFLGGVFLGFVFLNISFFHTFLKLYVASILQFSVNQKLLIIISLTLFIISILWSKTKRLSVGGNKIILLVVVSLAAISILLVLLHINKLQSTYDHTTRMFIFAVVSLSILSAFGIDALLKFQARKYTIPLAFIICIVVFVDLYPFSSFFYSIPLDEALKGRKAYEQLNVETTEGRYFIPFPYKPHLPLYRFEYPTRLVNRLRLNNENIYTPFTPLYSTHLYDALLQGGLEKNGMSPEFFLEILRWGNTNFVIFRQKVDNYESIIELMKNNGWEISTTDEDAVLLKNNDPSDFIHIYQNFKPVPISERENPIYWYDSLKTDVALYEGKNLLAEENVPTKFTSRILSWKRDSSTQIQTTVEGSSASLISISEAWYPGWKVFVDEKQDKIVRTNYAFLGVIVPSGQHTLVFSYQQSWYYIFGKIITLLSIFYFLFLVYRNLVRTKISNKYD